MKKLILILLLFNFGVHCYSQCSNSLIELAAAKSGTDALLIRDFKIKLEEGTMNRPSPVGRFQVYLNDGIQYRFNLANATNYEGKAIIQLYDRNRLVGSTFDTESKTDHQFFEFACDKSGTYQVLMSFLEGKRGCAIGIMSMILTDSLTTTANISYAGKENLETLYIGMENELNIAATEIPGGSLEIRIDQGTIEKKFGSYVVNVEKEGIATIMVTAIDKNGNISEIDSIDFNVSYIPLPWITIAGITGGMIQKHEIEKLDKIELNYSFEVKGNPYQLLEFTVSAESMIHEGLASFSEYLTTFQKDLIKKMDSGERVVISNIFLKRSDNTIIQLSPITLIIH